MEEQKIKLEQKKNRLAAEEIRLKLKERKMRTRNLIELGGLLVKAELNYLPINALYGALLSLAESLNENPKIKDIWIQKGHDAFNAEKLQKTAVILKFEEQPSTQIRDQIRSSGLFWNKFRAEWYGHVTDMESFKKILENTNHNLEIIDTN